MPRRVRSWVMRPSIVSPAKRTLPVSLVSVPQMQLTSVDLPEPLGPIKPRRSPVSTARAMPSSATKPPKRLLNPATSSRGILSPHAQLFLHKPDDSVRRDDDKGDQQEADDEQVDRGRDRHRRNLLQRAKQDRSDQRSDPAGGAA